MTINVKNVIALKSARHADLITIYWAPSATLSALKGTYNLLIKFLGTTTNLVRRIAKLAV